MAKFAGVLFRFDKTKDGVWLGMFGDQIKFETQKEVGDIVIASLHVKEYDLTDHQFIRLKINVRGAEIAILLPRVFVVGLVEGPNLDKFGFVER